jgi:hypothetical protein
MSYLGLLKQLEAAEIFTHAPETELTKPTQPGFVSCVSSIQGGIEKINAENDAPEITPEIPLTASRWWLIHYPDRDPLEVTCCPDATHAEILEQYPDAVAAEPFTPAIRQASAPLTASEESAIRVWLALIEETDTATIAEVIGQCQRDAEARDYFTGRAAAELPKPDPFPDDRRRCSQCLNLRGRVCAIAKPGGLVSANVGYRPVAGTLQRCAGYLPNATDTDQQSGGERWPGL